MKEFSLYRKRIIPKECILLQNDKILSFADNRLVTRWNVLHPKKDLHHGISCFFLSHGWKVSKFYDKQNQLLYWYIDVISHQWSRDGDALYVTDLLADVLIYPDGFVEVVDIDELSEALEAGDIDARTLCEALRKLDSILKKIYHGDFKELARYVESFE